MTRLDSQDPQNDQVVTPEQDLTPVQEPTPTQPPDGRDSVESKVYAGLQRKYQTLFNTHQELLDQSDQSVTRIADLELTNQRLEREKSAVLDQLSGLQATVKEREADLTQAQQQLAKWDIVKSDFPALAKVADLVPVGEPDEMREAFKLLDGAIKERSEEQARAYQAGTVPRAGASRQQEPTLTDDQLWEQIEKHAGTPEGEKWNDLWAKRLGTRQES